MDAISARIWDHTPATQVDKVRRYSFLEGVGFTQPFGSLCSSKLGVPNCMYDDDDDDDDEGMYR